MIDLHPISVPTDGLLHTQQNTACYVDNTEIGNGILYVTSCNLCWIGEEERGFSVNYQSMTVHAISRDLNSFPHPCIYTMASNLSCAYQKLVSDNEDDADENGMEDVEDGGYDNAEDDDDDEEKVIEIRFVPSDSTSLESMYEAINKGSALNPYEDSNSEAEEDFDPRREEGQGDHQAVVLNGHYGEEEDEEEDEGQFEDADDDMET